MNTYFKSWFYLLNFKDLLFFFVINDSKWAWLLAGQNRQIDIDIILTTGKLWLIENWNWKRPYAKFHPFDIRVIWGKELYYVLMESAENQMGQWKKQSELFCVVKKTKSVQKLVHQYSAQLINSDNMSEWVTWWGFFHHFSHLSV